MHHSFRPAESCPSTFMPSRHRGFTMVELVMVMVVVGILAAVAIPRFFDANVFQERGAADQVKAALRYGQKIAIAQRRTGGLVVTINSAAIPNCGIALNAGGNVDCTISNRVAVNPALPWVVTFDAIGVPGAAASRVIGTTTINVEAGTGYVH